MDQLRNFFIGDTGHHYIENGFSEQEGRAIAWIADQKPRGKFYGLVSGTFVAVTWQHWYKRMLASFGLRTGLKWVQALIIAVQDS